MVNLAVMCVPRTVRTGPTARISTQTPVPNPGNAYAIKSVHLHLLTAFEGYFVIHLLAGAGICMVRVRGLELEVIFYTNDVEFSVGRNRDSLAKGS